MSYATYTDLTNQFSDAEMTAVSDRTRTGNENMAVIAEAIQYADDLIDGYLRNRYTLPLVVVPNSLVGVACDIARYRLYHEQPTELIVQRYEMALVWLKDIARGMFSLDVGTADAELSTSMSYSTPARIFTSLVW